MDTPRLPDTRVTTAQERLEELAKNGRFKIEEVTILGDNAEYQRALKGDIRFFSDGFEAVINIANPNFAAMVYLERNNQSNLVFRYTSINKS